MQTVNDPARFGPETSPPASTAAPMPVTPPLWMAALAVAGALGLSLSMALPPTTKVSGGAVSTWGASAEKVEEIRRPGEVFMQPVASVDE